MIKMEKEEKHNMESIIEKDLEYFKVDKEEWNKTIALNKKKLLKIFLAGAVVASLVWGLVFLVYVKTGFVW
jgi:hypothetical protein